MGRRIYYCVLLNLIYYSNESLKCFHYLRGQAVGFYEGTTGLYAGPTYSDTESFGREIGRTKAKLLGLGLFAASPFVTGLGANMFASGNTLTFCSGGMLLPVGASISSSGIGIMGIGAATRDLADLVEKMALYKTGQLKHTRYWLNINI